MCFKKTSDFYRRTASIFLLLFFSSIFVFPLFSQEQEDEEWYLEKTITSITFSGLHSVKKSELAGITASYIGRTVESCVYELLDRLYALELFDDITPGAAHDKGDGAILTFTVKEKPVVTSITFRGNKQIRNAPLREALTIKVGDVFVESKVLVNQRAVRNVYLDKGYKDAKVSYEKKQVDEGIIITFVINEGNTTSITDIKFVGNTIAPSKTLKRQCKTKTVGLFKKGAFQEATLEQDRQAIQKYYFDRGYLDFHILDITRDVTPNDAKARDDMVLTYYLYEGSQYTFDTISFVGNQVFSTEKLNSLVSLKQGEIFNATEFQESLLKITDLYYENGYTTNDFSPAENRDSEEKKVSYVITVTERERSHIEKIIVKGNTKTKESVITREIPLESGDVFSKASLTNGLRNLYNLQFFSAVVPTIEPGSEANLLDVVVTVEEQMTNSIEFGLTFSGVNKPTDIPFSAFVGWSNSNLAGSGRTVSANLNIASDIQSISLGYGQRWLWGLPIEWNESLSFSHSTSNTRRVFWNPDGTINYDDYYMDYESWGFGLNSSLGHRWMPNFAIISASVGMSNYLINYIYDPALYVPYDIQISRYANKWGWSNSIWAKISLDGRDINYDPSNGWFFSQQLSWYGLLPIETDFYLRTDTKLEGYVKLLDIPFTEKWGLKLILAGYTGLSFQLPPPGRSVSENNKLYIDGMFNARGWTDIYNKVKGRAMWSNSVELRVPVMPGVVAIDAFFDFCAITEQPKDMFTNLTEDAWYFSLGPDVRFLIPQFPMRLMLANCFKIKDGKLKWYDTWKFVLSFNLVNK